MWDQILTVGFMTALISATVRMALPLAYAGLGELFLEKAGIINIGLEGVMLSGAFFSYVGMLISGNFLVGILFGIGGGILISGIHGFLCIYLKQNQSVSGIALNMFVVGLTSFFYKIMSTGKSYQQVETLSAIKIPILSEIPIIGEGFFNQDILTYSLYILIIVMVIFYRKTSMGLSFKAVGEAQRSADTAGIAVFRYQWGAIIVNGILGGIGGATLILTQLGKFSENMMSGRGYIALAAVILGRFHPVGMFLASLLFGMSNSIQIRLQAIGVEVPMNVLSMLPYVITLIALIATVGKSNGPAGLGKSYVRGSR